MIELIFIKHLNPYSQLIPHNLHYYHIIRQKYYILKSLFPGRYTHKSDADYKADGNGKCSVHICWMEHALNNWALWLDDMEGSLWDIWFSFFNSVLEKNVLHEGRSVWDILFPNLFSSFPPQLQITILIGLSYFWILNVLMLLWKLFSWLCTPSEAWRRGTGLPGAFSLPRRVNPRLLAFSWGRN